MMYLKFERSVRSQTTSQVVDAIRQYLAFAEEQETLGCLLDFQETKEFPRNTQYLVVDLQVSRHETQLESLKVLVESYY